MNLNTRIYKISVRLIGDKVDNSAVFCRFSLKNLAKCLDRFFGINNTAWIVGRVYYHRLGDPIDGLSEFLTRKRVDAFDEALYERYLAYAPEAALQPLRSTVCDVLENA